LIIFRRERICLERYEPSENTKTPNKNNQILRSLYVYRRQVNCGVPNENVNNSGVTLQKTTPVLDERIFVGLKQISPVTLPGMAIVMLLNVAIIL
jgi:hypothetical protein